MQLHIVYDRVFTSNRSSSVGWVRDNDRVFTSNQNRSVGWVKNNDWIFLFFHNRFLLDRTGLFLRLFTVSVIDRLILILIRHKFDLGLTLVAKLYF